ncbi:hypothetical protein GHT06_018290 [Daphnia sinensis]|uniref:Uncharacterized protein n=1 Tax=Daphnia sinensis TaxID=1820382 RepID=A0AAD5KN09_9CRUS|nr:hypothetical protein GHT06_018290 [Daphnia sinensis]
MNVCGQFIFRIRCYENIMKSIFLSNKSYGSKKANRNRGTENGRIPNSKPNTNDLETEWMTAVGVNQKSCSETII